MLFQLEFFRISTGILQKSLCDVIADGMELTLERKMKI